MSSDIIVACLALVGTLSGSYFANKKGQAIIEFRLKSLEDKVQAHNNLIERTYELEEKVSLMESEDKRQNERIKNLEAKK